MNPALAIVTPLIRAHNLPEILPEVERGLEFFDLTWWVVHDALYAQEGPNPEPPDGWADEHHWIRYQSRWVPGTGGERMQNWLLDRIPADSWWWGLADDNIMVPGAFEALRREVDDGAEIVVFPMEHSSGRLSSRCEAISPGNIDGGQVVFKVGAVGDLRWEDVYCPDGVFLSKLLQRTGSAKWRFLSTPVLRYNALR